MAAGLELDHVFVFVAPGGAEADGLARAGLVETYRRDHPGQGTTNVCYCFDNAYLELLWVRDAREIVSPAVARTCLAERADWRRTGASPFGIAVHAAPDVPLPFATWDYAAPFLPDGVTLPVAVASDDPLQPFMFRAPRTTHPDAWPDGRAGERQRPAGLAEIAAVQLNFPAGVEPADACRQLAAAGLLTLGRSEDGPRMVLILSAVDGGPPRRLSLPDFSFSRTTP